MKARMHLLLETMDRVKLTAKLHPQNLMPVRAMRRLQISWHPAFLVHMTTHPGQMSSHDSVRTGLNLLVCISRSMQQIGQLTLKGLMRPDLQQQRQLLCPAQRPVLWSAKIQQALPMMSFLEWKAKQMAVG